MVLRAASKYAPGSETSVAAEATAKMVLPQTDTNEGIETVSIKVQALKFKEAFPHAAESDSRSPFPVSKKGMSPLGSHLRWKQSPRRRR